MPGFTGQRTSSKLLQRLGGSGVSKACGYPTGGILVTIKYSLNGEPNSVSFYYEPGNNKTIRFKNQERVVWTKDSNR
jgi:hypothetical protein